MATTHRFDERVFALLVVYIGLFSAVVVEISNAGHVRWAVYAVFAPLIAAALLPFRHTLVISVLSIVAAGVIYGIVLPMVLPGGRAGVVVGVVMACAVGLVVCKVRLRLMIARRHLALLSDASERFGSKLGVTETARDLADIAVPRFADAVSVCLFDSVLRGGEPPTRPPAEPLSLRLVAQRPDRPGILAGGIEAGNHPQVSVPARYLGTHTPARADRLDDDDVRQWLAQDPAPAARTREDSLCAAIAVPLRARGSILGTVIFLRHRTHPFDDDDLVLAEEMGSRAALCLDNARQYYRERETSHVLQRSLLPRTVPELAAAEVASRYVPARHCAGVSGDWFDVIPLSGARVALVVGDVVGHGLLASATMTRLRTAVRTLADIDLQPDELLAHLDDVVLRLSSENTPTRDTRDALDVDGVAGEIGATCLYAVYDPVTGRCTLASAGHPPPIMVAPDGTVQVFDVSPGPFLGLGGLPFEAVDVQVPEGSVLALYTDGLILGHRRDPDSGLQGLVHALSTTEPSLDRRCQAVLEKLVDSRSTDDVVLLMARTRTLGTDRVAAWDLSSNPTVVADAREQAARQVAAWRLPEAAFATELIVSELVTNAIRYAQPPVRLSLIHDDHSLICEVSDGSTTTPHLRRARTLDEGGRGLFIVAQLAQRWGTRHNRHGKTIWAELATGDGDASLGIP
jgi:anti-sigma regulatory factor (Ser/Thr protein kinase)